MIVDKDLQNLVLANSLFSGVPKDQIKSFIKPKNFFEAQDGEIIFTNDDVANEIYLVVQGEVKIKYSETKEVEYKYLSDFFGENEITNDMKRTSTSIANKDCVLYRISQAEIKSMAGISKLFEKNLLNKSVEFSQDLFSHESVNTLHSEILPLQNSNNEEIDFNTEVKLDDYIPALGEDELETILKNIKTK